MKELADLHLKIIEDFPEPEFTSLRNSAFANFGNRSPFLAEVLAEDAGRRPSGSDIKPENAHHLRIGAFLETNLVGWSYSVGEGNQLHMVNSGISPDMRRRGIYSRLVETTIEYADRAGFSKIFSRHVPSNNAVIIPKLRLGFVVSGFEYSEVYGPLVHLTYLIGNKRRELYQMRSTPIVS